MEFSGRIEDALEAIDLYDNLRVSLTGGGRLFIDRPLPFLCLYRPPRRTDVGTVKLVQGEAAYLIAPTGRGAVSATRRLVRCIARRSVERFGAFMLLEL